MADYVVIRAAADLPEGFLPEELDGKWFNLDDVQMVHRAGRGLAVAVPSGRFEVNADGDVAEVWEMRP